MCFLHISRQIRGSGRIRPRAQTRWTGGNHRHYRAPDGLPNELTGLTGWVACIADARPLHDYIAVLDAAGLRTTHTQRHDEALRTMIDIIEARLKLMRMTAPDQLATAGINIDAILHYTQLAGQATAVGTLGYALLTAEKPT